MRRCRLAREVPNQVPRTETFTLVRRLPGEPAFKSTKLGPRHIVLPPKSEPYGGRGVLVKLDDPSEETADSLRYQGLGKRTWKDKMCRLVLSGFEPRDIAACGRKSVRIPDPEYNLRSREILAERDAYVARREEGLRAMREVYESPAARRQAIRAQQQRQGRMQPPPEECDDEEYDEDPYNIDEMDSNMYGRGRA